jgi:uncharacterized protein
MVWEAIIAGFSLGAFGSLHCVGMCGPLAMALPVHHLSKGKKLFAIFLYQVGRVFTYSLMGLIIGLAGRRIYMAGFQQWFSIIMGIVVVILVVQYWILKKYIRPSFFNAFYNRVQQLMIRFLKSKKTINFLLLGTANGLLPCGMVYVAIAGALTTSQITNSVLFMAFFGLGTLPAMMAISYFGQLFSISIRNNLRKALPALVTLMGVILILRGLNLGIPFISPVLQQAPGQAIICH